MTPDSYVWIFIAGFLTAILVVFISKVVTENKSSSPEKVIAGNIVTKMEEKHEQDLKVKGLVHDSVETEYIVHCVFCETTGIDSSKVRDHVYELSMIEGWFLNSRDPKMDIYIKKSKWMREGTGKGHWSKEQLHT